MGYYSLYISTIIDESNLSRYNNQRDIHSYIFSLKINDKKTILFLQRVNWGNNVEYRYSHLCCNYPFIPDFIVISLLYQMEKKNILISFVFVYHKTKILIYYVIFYITTFKERTIFR